MNGHKTADGNEFAAIVIGTGFGGAVVACRLAQKEKDILVLERGRRYESQSPADYPAGGEPEWSDFPKLPSTGKVLPDPRRWTWMQDQGLWDLRDLDDIFTVQAAGYGGGSLVYANVHLRAPERVFGDWPFTRQDLDQYYDLAAYMLDIKPITEAPASARSEKTEQLQSVAETLGRQADFFYPPLAINFKDGSNRFGRAQSACNGCAECCTGCRFRAKNTLDLNYLAVVDESQKAKVRTQAEATLILANRKGYTVRYLDHLRGGDTCEVTADWVFVCAGAVSSTELLLRSRCEGGLPKLVGRRDLGKKYYPNADAIGIVYDAKTPENKSRQISPTKGPTITASIYHERQPDDAQDPGWFLLEEGGFPPQLARHIGLLRLPALLRRNRHDDRDDCNQIQCVEGNASSPVPPVGAVETEPIRSLPAALHRLLWNDRKVFEMVIPPQLRAAFEKLEEELDPFLQRHLQSFVPEVKNEVLKVWPYKIARPFLPILRVLLKLYKRTPDGDIRNLDGDIVTATKNALTKKYGVGLGAEWKVRLETASEVVQWLSRFDDTDGCHSQSLMVLLAMGPDTEPGEFKLDKGVLKVDLRGVSKPVYTRQECLMRDVACALGGKLRVNPLWSYARTPITVHSQGGCPMSKDPADGVTDDFGQVHAYPGLFVMDAAAFPGPVGVNPSATIAAVAERNMEHHFGPAPDMAEVEAWKKEQEWWPTDPRRSLEPPSNGPSVAPENKPVGIEWVEEMSGFHDMARKPQDDPEYELAEGRGREKKNVVSVQLTATVEDVAKVIWSKEHTVGMKGSATLRWKAEAAPPQALEVEGTLDLPGASGSIPAGGRLMVLTLRSTCNRWKLKGYKRLRDDPGPDTWRDTSTLFLTIEELTSGEKSWGVIRLSLDEFLFKQLPTFRVINTDDPARITWALTSFGAYFFGVLQGIYFPLPRLDRMLESINNNEIR